MAEFTGGQAGLYVLDSIETRSEQLYALRRENRLAIRGLTGYVWPVPISEIPLGRPRRAFVEPLYLLTDLDYTLVNADKENGELTITRLSGNAYVCNAHRASVSAPCRGQIT